MCTCLYTASEVCIVDSLLLYLESPTSPSNTGPDEENPGCIPPEYLFAAAGASAGDEEYDKPHTGLPQEYLYADDDEEGVSIPDPSEIQFYTDGLMVGEPSSELGDESPS